MIEKPTNSGTGMIGTKADELRNRIDWNKSRPAAGAPGKGMIGPETGEPPVLWKPKPSSYWCRAAAVVALFLVVLQAALGAPETSNSSTETVMPDPIVTAIQTRNFERAEKEARLRVAGADTAAPQASDTTIEKRKALLALATVLGARAWDADLRSRASRISGNDVLLLIVITLFAGGIVALLFRYGPQRPKLMEQAEQWMEKAQTQHRDDSFKQTAAAFYSLLILGIVAGGLFVVLYFLIHLIAQLDSPSREGANVRKYFSEAKLVIAQTRPSDTRVTIEDYDVLGLYADFLRKTGDSRQAIEVEKRIRALQICGPGKLPQSGSEKQTQ